MRKCIVLFIFVMVFICNNTFAAKYSEDNAAYWYQKAFNDLRKLYEANGFNKTEDGKKIYDLKSLEEFNKFKPETKKLFEGALKSFLTDIKKAKDQKKCLFWKMPLNDKDENKTQFADRKMFFSGFKMANAVAWYAVSINKPDIAGAIWQTMLNVSIKVAENNLNFFRVIAGGATIRLVIPSLDNYCSNGASDEFKSKFVQYLKKWPQSIFDLKDNVKVIYDYQKTNIELYGKEQKYLAGLFGADLRCLDSETSSSVEPRIKENPQCASNRRVVSGAIEMFQMDESEGNISMEPDFSIIEDEKERQKLRQKWSMIKYLKEKIKEKEESEEEEKPEQDEDDSEFGDTKASRIEDDKNKLKDLELELKKRGIEINEEKTGPTDFSKLTWEETISLLERTGYLNLRRKADYSCPEKGKRTIKAVKTGNEIGYEISCSYSVAKDPMDDFKPDSEPMKLAKEYRETQFENDKKQLFEYYEKMLKFDHKKPMTEEEIKNFSSSEMSKYEKNTLFIWMGFDYSSFRKSLSEYQKFIDDFVKKYDKK